MGVNQADPGKRFRELLARPQGVFAYGIYDAMSAYVAKMAGAEAIYVGGYAAAGRNMLPDMGILSSTEVRDHISTIALMVDLPIIADVDDGYGGIHNVRRIAREVLSLPNVAGIHIEDQRYPKRCGHIAGKEVLPIEEFLGKLKAAIDVRNQVAPTKVIIARTDAFSAAGGKKDPHVGGDIKEAIRRGLAYAKAGADLIWCEFPSPDTTSALSFAQGMHKRFPDFPLAFNISPSFKPGTWEESKITGPWLNEIGYKFRFCTYGALLAAMHAVYTSAREFSEDEIQGLISLRARLSGSPVESVMRVVGVDQYQEIETKYDPGAEKRLRTSEGFTGERLNY